MHAHRASPGGHRGAIPVVSPSQDLSIPLDAPQPCAGTEFVFSSNTEVGRVAEYLMRIANGLRQGRVSLSAPGRVVKLEPAEIVRLELGARSRPDEGKASLEFEISWEPVRS